MKNHQSDFLKEYSIIKIGLFGSFARNESTEQSDIDILFEFQPGTTDIFRKKQELKTYLKTYFQRDVDLCREKYLKPYAQEYILHEVIYA